MNIEELSQAPWIPWHKPETGSTQDYHGIAGLPMLARDHAITFREADAEFIALARNAFDVMMRRGWHTERYSTLGGGFMWRIPMSLANDMIRQHGANAAQFKQFASLAKWLDPFTALVEADKWYKENVEK